MQVDYHVHTNFSADSDAKMEDQCRAAIARGLAQIAFTEHEDYNPEDSTSYFFKHDEYWREIERCRAQFAGQLIIRGAIEISEPHRHQDQVRKVLDAYPWDFVLGSLHWVDQKHNTFLPEYFTKFGDPRDSWRRYFTELIDLANDGDFDVLSHMDYPMRYGGQNYRDTHDLRDYERLIRSALVAVTDHGKGIEINTSPLRRGLPDPNPPALVVEWYREVGGETLCIGSDSHAPEHTGANLADAAKIAREAGFTHIATFERRKRTLVALE